MRFFIIQGVATILAIWTISCNSNPTPSKSLMDGEEKNEPIKIGDKLELFYPLDSVKELWIDNWKGNHKLSDTQKDSLIKFLKKSTFFQNSASIKPGHLYFTFKFTNGKSDRCYGSNGILIFEGGEFYNRNKTNGEFHLSPSINFENY